MTDYVYPVMDVDREIAAADRRLERRARQLEADANARLQERWPLPGELIVEAPANAAEAYGQMLRALHDGFVALAESVTTGWTAVDRARALERRPAQP